MDDDWISASVALALVARTVPIGQARDAICHRAGAGLIRARASRFFTDGRAFENSEIPAGFRSGVGAPSVHEDWATGDLESLIDDDLNTDSAFGVEFYRADIERIRGVASASARLVSDDAGRQRSDLWPEWIAELVALVHEIGVPEGHGSQGQAELIQAVEEALAKRGRRTLARTTVQSTVKAVLNRLRADPDTVKASPQRPRPRGKA